jgi:hypothetical protein
LPLLVEELRGRDADPQVREVARPGLLLLDRLGQQIEVRLERSRVVAAVVHRHQVLDPRRKAAPVLANETAALDGVPEHRR